MEEKLQPLISVIVPVYNGENYLTKCIESIEAQTYQNLEIVLINDGSTDHTAQVCEDLTKEYGNIHVITLGDEGVSTARNTGLAAAKGELVTLVDADDRLRPEVLELLYEKMLETESDICGCSFQMWKEETQWQTFLSEKCNIEAVKSYSGAEYLKEELLKGNSRCWSKLYKKSLMENCRFHKDLSIGEDMFFLVELLSFAEKITEITYPGYGYYQNAGGAMNRPFTPRYMEQITCWEMAREKVVQIDSSLKDQVTTILIMAILLTAGKLAFLSGKEREAQKQYITICHDKMKKELKETGAYKALSKGYKIKAKLFGKMPKLYLTLYHLRKYAG